MAWKVFGWSLVPAENTVHICIQARLHRMEKEKGKERKEAGGTSIHVYEYVWRMIPEAKSFCDSGLRAQKENECEIIERVIIAHSAVRAM